MNLKNLNAAITIAALVGCSTSATADKGTTDVVVADGTTPTDSTTSTTAPTATTTPGGSATYAIQDSGS